MTPKEAIERIKTRFDKWALDDKDLDAIQTIIPELAESENEKIRKYIIFIIDEYAKICKKEGIIYNESLFIDAKAYLEKQKEQKPAEWSGLTDKKLAVETLRDVAGALKEHNLYHGLQESLIDLAYDIEHMYIVQPAEWSEEDEKRVKQLIYDTEHIRAEYEKRKKELDKSFNDELIKDCDEQITWLKSLSLKKRLDDVDKLYYNKWSEEDEINLGDIKCALYDYYGEERAEELYNMLKSLRPQPKEDLDAIAKREYARGKQDGYWEGVKAERESCKTFHYESPNWPPKMPDLPTETTTNEGISSIKPHWKPSEEQMAALKESSTSWMNEHMGNCELLKSLYNDLKKL